jgi:hypothetical protein
VRATVSLDLRLLITILNQNSPFSSTALSKTSLLLFLDFFFFFFFLATCKCAVALKEMGSDYTSVPYQNNFYF